MTFDEIVSDYICGYRDRERAEMRFFEIQRSPSAAIRKAAVCQRPSGKRHSHQRRIPGPLLEQVEAMLFDFLDLRALVRDLEVDGSNQFAQTILFSDIDAISGFSSTPL
jgi:hypothetical protein